MELNFDVNHSSGQAARPFENGFDKLLYMPKGAFIIYGHGCPGRRWGGEKIFDAF